METPQFTRGTLKTLYKLQVMLLLLKNQVGDLCVIAQGILNANTLKP